MAAWSDRPVFNAIITCLAHDHEPRLALAAALICIVGSGTSFGIFARAAAVIGRARTAWQVAGAVEIGTTIWSTHFLAMLAYDPGLPVAYEPALTALSVVIGTVLAGLGIALARPGQPARSVLAGGIVALGIAGMHFTGMAAIQVPAFMHWDLILVVLAVGLGIVLAAAALLVPGRDHSWRGHGMATVLLVAAICAVHFTAMAAFQLEPTPLLPVPEPQLAGPGLAAAVIAAALVVIGFAGIATLVDQRFAAQAMREADRLRILVNATSEGIVIFDDGGIQDANKSLLRLLGRSRPELLDGGGAALLAVLRQRMRAPATSHLVELGGTDGEALPVEIVIDPLEIDGRQAWVAAVRDLRERRQAEARIRYLALHDPLTNLPNRELFNERFERALEMARRYGQPLALLCLDLDRFKEINDLHGHAVGDAVLFHVAGVLQESIREHDFSARLGGDEFVIVQTGDVDPEAAATLAERLLDRLRAGVELGGSRIELGASVGIALCPGDGETGAPLLNKADMALYDAKALGRGSYRFFEAAMEAALQDKRSLERDLRLALATDGLDVYFQPQIEAMSGRIIGFEALVRWPHPVRGMVSPGEFVPLAEACGLISAVGEFVLRRACAAATAWPSTVRVAVNLSPLQFERDDLAELVLRVLDDTGLGPRRLELEITEGALLKDSSAVLATLSQLKLHGIQIAMDDFGTGFSSLGYLHRFPFDRLKIDRSFIATLIERCESASIVRAIIQLSHNLGLSVVAEGVETQDQMRALQTLGCDEVQGYLVSRPLPVTALAGALANLTMPTLPAKLRPAPMAPGTGAGPLQVVLGH